MLPHILLPKEKNWCIRFEFRTNTQISIPFSLGAFHCYSPAWYNVNSNIENICKVSSGISGPDRMSIFIPTLNTLNKSLVQCYFDYCCPMKITLTTHYQIREVVKTIILEQCPPNHKTDGGFCLYPPPPPRASSTSKGGVLLHSLLSIQQWKKDSEIQASFIQIN